MVVCLRPAGLEYGRANRTARGAGELPSHAACQAGFNAFHMIWRKNKVSFVPETVATVSSR